MLGQRKSLRACQRDRAAVTGHVVAIARRAGVPFSFFLQPAKMAWVEGRLTAACSAWNMSCGSPEIRRQQLEQYLEGYQRFNPATSPSDLAGIRSDMESLMGRKLEMFPLDQRQIVSAKVVMVGDDYRIEVASATAQQRQQGDQQWQRNRNLHPHLKGAGGSH